MIRSATRPVQPVWVRSPRCPAPVSPVEVLVERDQVVPGVVFLEPGFAAENGPAAAVVEEEPDQPRRDVIQRPLTGRSSVPTRLDYSHLEPPIPGSGDYTRSTIHPSR